MTKRKTKVSAEDAETVGVIRRNYCLLEDSRHDFSRGWITWQSGGNVGRGDLQRELRTIARAAVEMADDIGKLDERRGTK
jgi:hypothetical protein